MSFDEARAMVTHYARLGYARHVQTTCATASRVLGNDPALSFWGVFGIVAEGSYGEAITKLEGQLSGGDKEMDLACMACITHAHKSARVVDWEAVGGYETRMASAEKSASNGALVEFALFHHLADGGDAAKAKDTARRVLAMDSSDSRAKTLLGWIELTGIGDDDPNKDDANDAATASADVVFSGNNSRRQRAAKALRVFDELLSSHDLGSDTQIDALVGKSHSLTALSRYDNAVDVMNELAARHPGFAPAASEKAKARLAACDFSSALENAEAGLRADNDDTECHRIVVFLTLTRAGDYALARKQITALTLALERREPRNVKLLVETSSQIARVAGGDVGVLQACGILLEKASALSQKESPVVLLEMAHQLRFLNKTTDALAVYRRCARFANESRDARETQTQRIANSASYGAALCFLRSGELQDCGSELEKLKGNGFDQNGVPFLSALAQMQHQRNLAGADETANALEKALSLFFQNVNKLPPAVDFFLAADPDTICRCALLFTERDFTGEMIGVSNGASSSSGRDTKACADSENNTNSVDLDTTRSASPRNSRTLEALCARAPGLIMAQEFLMRARFASGSVDAAQRTVEVLLQLKENHAEAHVMLGRIHVAKGDLDAARRALDAATANDFAVRQTTAYLVVSAQCRAASGDTAGSLDELEAAMSRPGVRVAMKRGTSSVPVSTADRASIFVSYANALHSLHKADEAEMVLDEATSVFAGTTVEIFVMIARCEAAVKRGDDTKALRALASVTPTSPHYPAATMALAKVHLKSRNDPKAFIRCHVDLAEHKPGDVNSWLLLAEAYGTVGAPCESVTALEKAQALTPNDPEIARTLGAACVATHAFQKARNFYELAERLWSEVTVGPSRERSTTSTTSSTSPYGSSPYGKHTTSRAGMRMELAVLYKRLRRFDDAERVIFSLVGSEFGDIQEGSRDDDQAQRLQKNTPNLSSTEIERNVNALKLLCAVKTQRNDQAGYLRALRNVKVFQEMWVQKAQRGLGETSQKFVDSAKRALSKTCAELALRYASFHDLETSLKLYDEALMHDKNSLTIMSQVADLKLNVGDAAGAEIVLQQITRLDAEHETANLMLAELMFLRDDVDGAVFHFRELLTKNPKHTTALAQLAKLLHRAGRLEEIDFFFENAERALGGAQRARSNPGFAFAKGLVAKSSRNWDQALEYFNRCRQDPFFFVEATYEMTEIYLAPFSFMTKKFSTLDANTKKQRVIAAEQILREVSDQRIEPRHTILSAYCLMSLGEAKLLDQAFELCAQVISRDADNAPALLATAACFDLQKLGAKAKAQVKRIQKLPRRADEAEAFESAWLVLAEQAFDAGKVDVAQDLCQKCLRFNKSCSEAWEIMGMICERETTSIDAAECYENAWRHCKQNDPGIGFKLAFVLFKVRSMVQCVDVCRAVLQKFPEYPKIKKDIMKKAQMAIKP